MNRDQYWQTRGALAGMFAAVLLLGLATCAGVLGGYSLGNYAIAVGAAQGAMVVIMTAVWALDVIGLGRLPPSVRAAFHAPSPRPLPTWTEDPRE